MLPQLLPSRRDFPGDDPIFALNAEANARKASGEDVINATVGALLDDQGQLVVLDTVMDLYRELKPAEIAPYAPIAGDRAYLSALVQRYWPDLPDFGVGCATPGGTGALALSIRNFLETGEAVMTLAPYWGPYATICAEQGVRLDAFPQPEAGHTFDPAQLKGIFEDQMHRQGRMLLWFNDPCHNPTGRSASPVGRTLLFEALRAAAKHGPVTLLLDLAYLEYSADPAEVDHALRDYAAFARQGEVLVGASLSTSKALTLYGARAGALVFPWSRDAALQSALTMSCRGAFSNAPKAPQSLVVRLARDGKAQARLNEEHRHWSQVLEARARALSDALRARKLRGLAWQGGFFVTLPAPNPMATAEALKDLGVFVVPLPEGLRVGLCGLRAADADRFAEAYAGVMASAGLS
jgi:aspartate/tyrosine/aromatic aminotransferase